METNVYISGDFVTTWVGPATAMDDPADSTPTPSATPSGDGQLVGNQPVASTGASATAGGASATSTSAATSSASAGGGTPGLSTGAIIGIAVAVAVVLVAALVFAYLLLRQRQRNRRGAPIGIVDRTAGNGSIGPHSAMRYGNSVSSRTSGGVGGGGYGYAGAKDEMHMVEYDEVPPSRPPGPRRQRSGVDDDRDDQWYALRSGVPQRQSAGRWYSEVQSEDGAGGRYDAVTRIGTTVEPTVISHNVQRV